MIANLFGARYTTVWSALVIGIGAIVTATTPRAAEAQEGGFPLCIHENGDITCIFYGSYGSQECDQLYCCYGTAPGSAVPKCPEGET